MNEAKYIRRVLLNGKTKNSVKLFCRTTASTRNTVIGAVKQTLQVTMIRSAGRLCMGMIANKSDIVTLILPQI